ncbi:MAG: formylglycine-generating enzyme family protein [Proteobacteria bacterium]|nr:formylglycine-generating enzyme family protein [Pseudomonadota bacterium]
MKKSILSALTVLFLCSSANVFAEDMVRIPASGDKAVGYKACAIEDIQNCSAADVQKTSIDAFSIDIMPVTNDDLQACVTAGKCILDDATKNTQSIGIDTSKGLHPAVVSYELSEQYCAYVGKKLPTEAQWLAAALSDGVKKCAWGDEELATAAARTDLYNFSNLVDAGSMPSAQTNGIYDMSGNGLEWIQAPIMKGESSPDVACSVRNSRACMGAAPLPLYQKIGIYEGSVATFRCVKAAQ